jgi:hypothetical protein
MLRSTRGCTGNFDEGSRCGDCSSSRDRRSDARVANRDRMFGIVAIDWHCANSSCVIYFAICMSAGDVIYGFFRIVII